MVDANQVYSGYNTLYLINTIPGVSSTSVCWFESSSDYKLIPKNYYYEIKYTFYCI